MEDSTQHAFRIELDGRAVAVERCRGGGDGRKSVEDLVRVTGPAGSAAEIPVSFCGAVLHGLQSVTSPSERRLGPRRAAPLPRNTGLPWTDSDMEDLEKRFLDGETIQDLADHFERTRGAVESRLVMLGVVEDPFGRPRGASKKPKDEAAK